MKYLFHRTALMPQSTGDWIASILALAVLVAVIVFVQRKKKALREEKEALENDLLEMSHGEPEEQETAAE